MLACRISPSLHSLFHVAAAASSTINFQLSYGLFRLHSHGKSQFPPISRSKTTGYRLKSTKSESGLSSLPASPFNLDPQSQDFHQLLWLGPLPGDLAEVEAYCRIFRAAEQLHGSIMDILCNPETGECAVSYKIESEDLLLLEEKIVVGLGHMAALLNRGREEVLSGRFSLMKDFCVSDLDVLDGKLTPLATFRNEMKKCCKNLQQALESYFSSFEKEGDNNIWRKLQRLKNVCFDVGLAREDNSPIHMLFANWTPVYLSSKKEDSKLKDSKVSFWRGGLVTEEGLIWLIDKGFKTIVDLRAETVRDDYYQVALQNAISCGKVQLVQLPVEVGTAPSMDQVEEFASLVSDPSNWPLYMHSQEGVWRTSAMVSRWRQYCSRSSQCLSVDSDETSASSSQSNRRPHSDAQKHVANRHDDLLSTSENGSLQKPSDTNRVREDYIQEQDDIGSTLYKDNSTSEGHFDGHLDSTESVKTKPGRSSVWVENPLKSQLPCCDIFSKSEMTNFLRNRNVSPKSFLERNKRRQNARLYLRTKTIFAKPAMLDGRFTETTNSATSVGTEISTSRNEHLKNVSTLSSQMVENIENDRSMTSLNEDNCADSSKLSASREDAVDIVSGNMCASMTGVVRVQSRKKAEMFLVRTDGFSCARERVTESSLAFTHPSTQQQMLMWKSQPKTVLLLKKLGNELMEQAKEVASFLHYQEKMNVLVEPDLHDIFARMPGFGFVQTFYNQDTSDLHERVDFVACLGGDGVILHASNLFRGAVPPVVSFNLGSLGFLTSHNFKDYKQDLGQIIHGNNTTDGVYITLRMRLRCEIFRNGKAMPGKVFDVLNEVVADRGSNPYLSKIECYEHDRLITKVQGDGVIIATPTGSTAYSTAAGGSMVHPNVPCMLFTPICPHSLSFRPVILPDSARLVLKIPEDARSNAWVSFDGKRRQQLSKGDSVQISMSEHPLPTVNKSDQTGDWFHSLIRCLNWNERLDQRAL